MRVLLHDSHSIYDPNIRSLRAYGGAPGESVFVRALNDKLVPFLRARGIEAVRVAGDMRAHAEFEFDWDLFLASHYESDTHGHASGWFWGRAASSTQAAADDRFGSILERRYRALAGVPEQRQEWMTVNVTDYYGFRSTSEKTPGVLVEFGVGAPVCNGHGFDKAPDHDWLRANIDRIAEVIVDSIAEFGGIQKTPSEFTVLVPSTVTAAQLRAFCPTAPAGVPELYASLAPQAGIRTEVAFAQAVKETNRFQFTGTAKPEWHNPAGLGVTGSPDVGNRFPDWESGVRAHLGHLLWYFGEHQPDFCDKDQRHFGGHKGLANDVRLLNGKWAVPGVGYGESIAATAKTIPLQEEPVTRDQFRQWWLEMYREVGVADLFDRMKKVDTRLAKHKHETGEPVMPAEE